MHYQYLHFLHQFNFMIECHTFISICSSEQYGLLIVTPNTWLLHWCVIIEIIAIVMGSMLEIQHCLAVIGFQGTITPDHVHQP